jgi:hypothetical protein
LGTVGTLYCTVLTIIRGNGRERSARIGSEGSARIGREGSARIGREGSARIGRKGNARIGREGSARITDKMDIRNHILYQAVNNKNKVIYLILSYIYCTRVHNKYTSFTVLYVISP